MSVHTPGPWVVWENPSGGAEVEAAGVSIADVKSRGGVPHPTQEHCLANARLIAAAPDMLEALNALFGAELERCMSLDGKPDQTEAVARARAAIAKAEGK